MSFDSTKTNNTSAAPTPHETPTTTDPMRAFGKLLHNQRLARNLTRHDVADRIGVSTVLIEIFEDGFTIPDPSAWARYCAMVSRKLRNHDAEWRAARNHEKLRKARLDLKVKEAGTSGVHPARPVAEKPALNITLTPVSASSATQPKPVENHPMSLSETPKPIASDVSTPTSTTTPGASAVTARDFPRMFAAACKQSKLSRHDIAAMIGITYSAVEKWEICGTLPVRRTVLKLAELFPELAAFAPLARDIAPPVGRRRGTTAQSAKPAVKKPEKKPPAQKKPAASVKTPETPEKPEKPTVDPVMSADAGTDMVDKLTRDYASALNRKITAARAVRELRAQYELAVKTYEDIKRTVDTLHNDLEKAINLE